jgi:hypothetical protein
MCLIDINCLLAQPVRAAWLETMTQAGAESLILSPGRFVVQAISWLWPTRATIHYAQGSSGCTHSPIVLTNTRFRRRPSRLAGQPFRLALKDPLPGAEPEPAVRHRHHRCASPPMTCNGKQMPFPASRGVGIVPRPCSGHLAGAVMQPAQRPSSSLTKTLAMMFMAFTRVNALLITYHSRPSAGRGLGGNRPRPEQPQLNPAFTGEHESCCGSARRSYTQ